MSKKESLTVSVDLPGYHPWLTGFPEGKFGSPHWTNHRVENGKWCFEIEGHMSKDEEARLAASMVANACI